MVSPLATGEAGDAAMGGGAPGAMPDAPETSPDTASPDSGEETTESGPLPDVAPSDVGSAGPPAADDGGGGGAANGAPDGDVVTTSADAGECADPVFGAPEPIVGLDITGALWGPSLSADGRTLYFGAVVGSREHVYVATRPDRGVTFSAASAVSINSASDEGTPFPSRDGLALYFYSTRPGGLGGRDLWVATRLTAQSDFLLPLPLVADNSPLGDHTPSLSADGLTLYFASNRPGGVGGYDVYVATRALPGGLFSAPVLLAGDAVNSPADDEDAALSPDGRTIYFASARSGSMDIWSATRSDASEPFSGAVRLDALSSPGDDDNPFVTADGQELFYSSDRDGTQRLWRSVRQCP